MRAPRGTLAVVVLLAAGTAIATAARPEPPAPSATAQSVEVIGATAVCPDLRQGKDELATRVSIGAAPLPAGRTSEGGLVEAVRLSSQERPAPVGIADPGQVTVGYGTSIDKDGLVVDATGTLAAGLEVEQVTRGEDGIDRGLAGLRCDAPRTDAWFVGGATLLADTTTLVLANVDDTPATVDVTVYAEASKDGPPDPRPGQGITLQPHTRLVVPLDTLAPGRAALTVHVASRRGRFSAGLRHARLNPGTPLGVDWVPRSEPPATTVVVPGIPQGPGLRQLQLTNPGNDDVVAKLTITTSDGQFVPTDFDAITVPAQTTVALRVDRLADDSAFSATLTSDGGPIVAGVFITDTQPGSRLREFAYTGSSPSLTGPALMTDLVIDRPTESTLILSALQDAATVVVTPIRVVGTRGALPAPKTVRVPAGRTATLRLSTFYPPGTSTRLALEVRPLEGSGPVWASRYLRERGARGPLVTLLDLQGPAQRVQRPVAREDARLGS